MTLSLASIYQPLTDFFSNQFLRKAGRTILFRFDKYGFVLSDQDFISPTHPELGYLPALAMEKFSDLVNHIPIESSEGLTILLSTDSIDSTYFFRLLSPSLPYLPNGIDDATKQAMISSFNTVKAESLKIWNNVKAESISGLMLQYKPSLASPENWYDMSKHEVWTSHSFQITGASSETDRASSNQLWRLKLSDVAMRRVLQLSETGNDDSKVDITDRILKMKANSVVDQVSRVDLGQAEQVSSFAAQPVERERSDSVALHTTYLQQYRQLDVSKRLIVDQYLGHKAPTQPVKTNRISISFDYCPVHIRRPWYESAFINEKSWYIPTVPKGQMTTSSLAGTLPLLPIGFVALRNLNIEANWDSEDVMNASVATHFGSFRVEAGIANNKLSHPGLQIMGWLLQKMPELPPNTPPA